jgi:hypothetical protein
MARLTSIDNKITDGLRRAPHPAERLLDVPIAVVREHATVESGEGSHARNLLGTLAAVEKPSTRQHMPSTRLGSASDACLKSSTRVLSHRRVSEGHRRVSEGHRRASEGHRWVKFAPRRASMTGSGASIGLAAAFEFSFRGRRLTFTRMDERTERYRACKARLDIAGDPSDDVALGLYMPRPKGAAAWLLPRLRSGVAGASAIVGANGTGKTTELYVLANEPFVDLRAHYIDVTCWEHGDELMGAGEPRPGVLVARAALALLETIPDRDRPVGEAEQIEAFLLAAPEPMVVDDVGGGVSSTVFAELLASFRSVQSRIRIPRLAFFIDGLDRYDVSSFSAFVEEDLKALTTAGVSVVVVAPNRIRLAENVAIHRLFDGMYVQTAMDVALDPSERVVAEVILRRRLDALAGSAEIAQIVRASGGILRDAVAIASLSVDNAFLDERDVISEADVAAAIEQFGRQFLVGLRGEALEKLRRIDEFQLATESDFAALGRRRVIEYAGPPQRFAIHPALRASLAKMEGA